MPSLINANLASRPKKQQRQRQAAAQFQSVFRVRPNKINSSRNDTIKFQFAQPGAGSSFSLTEEQQQEQGHAFHPRRSHRKSRLGCVNCKKRRVKCDETKPECTRCLTYGVTCDFLSDTATSGSGSDSDGSSSNTGLLDEDLQLMMLSGSSSPDTTVSNMSLVAVERAIAQVTGLGNDEMRCGDRLYLLGMGDRSSQLMNLCALQNFITRSTEAIPDAKMKRTMKTGLIRTAFEHAHLMHTVLAASYLHLNHVRPGNKYRRIQEAFHWQRAIQLYQGAMQEPIGPHNTDALMGSCILLGMNTLLPVGFKPQDSWVFTRDPADLNWLAVQGGLRCLIDLTRPFIAGSIWGESFQESGDRLKPFQQEVPGRVDMYEALANLCDIDDRSSAETNPYHWHVQLLSRMLTLEPYDQPSNYNIFVSWMGQILPEFITLLRAHDERALLILSWWMALMCAMASYQVWINARIVPECRAICMYLEANSCNPEVLRLLQWPAAACGYRNRTPEALERVTITTEPSEWT